MKQNTKSSSNLVLKLALSPYKVFFYGDFYLSSSYNKTFLTSIIDLLVVISCIDLLILDSCFVYAQGVKVDKSIVINDAMTKYNTTSKTS